MSVLTVLVVPPGLLMAADRNITLRVRSDVGGGAQLEQVGYMQRPKVLEWPDGSAIVGYFGLARIAGQATDRWLYRYIGRNMPLDSIADAAQRLTADLNAEVPADDAGHEPLVIHLAGFDDIDGEPAPVVWFIHNTAGLTPQGRYIVGGRFGCTEELRTAQPADPRFVGKSADEIRAELRARPWSQPFWFRQAADLGAVNALDEAVRLAMTAIVHTHPAQLHPVPQTLIDWSQHLKLAVLTFGAYFEAFYPPYEQVIGGGVDVVSIPWP